MSAVRTAAFQAGRIYSRADNPSYDQAEALIASLERAASALLFSSGMSASAALFDALMPGEGALVPRNMYWGLRKWLLEFAAPRGLKVELYDNSSLDDLAAKARAGRPKVIWIETPANPTWEVTDIAAAASIAREVGALVAVDSTAATPLLTRPIELGANIVMHSATKYLNGHSDVIAGALATSADNEFWQRGALRARRKRSGTRPVRGLAAPARHADAALAGRGLVRQRDVDRAAFRGTPEAFARRLSRPAIASGLRGRREADERAVSAG